MAVHPVEGDTDPSPIGQSLLDTVDDRLRIRAPMVRQSYLREGPGAALPRRGREPFVEVSWEEAETLVANELDRVRCRHGNEAIYGGSYGWASAGRFHHAQSQIHRFLAAIGGYTSSQGTYSLAAGETILPHVLGDAWRLVVQPTSWPNVIEHSELMVCFGGMPLKNAQINAGGTRAHKQRGYMHTARKAGVQFINISPLQDDIAEMLDARWIAPLPNTDVALMLAIAHCLVQEEQVDLAFLRDYCVGHERFLEYVAGRSDGVVKSAEWAAPICGVEVDQIRELATIMATRRTMISVSWSLTRQDHGEQPYWMAVSLAALLGQIGLPGGGVGFGYAAEDKVGSPALDIGFGRFPALPNPCDRFIPVARVADMLLHPNQSFDFNGQQLKYPDIRLVYWAGGNPFHHHQDLNRLHVAWQKPETIICNEIYWNAHARHADIVLPANTGIERNDIGGGSGDVWLQAMPKLIESVGESRSDYEIFMGLSHKLGVADLFTEGRTEQQWLRSLYERTQTTAAQYGVDMPSFANFWRDGVFEFPSQNTQHVMLSSFRDDPNAAPLATPSGRIELFSERIDRFGYTDCIGHACWFEPVEWLGGTTTLASPLHLISNQPTTKLHSQLDQGCVSRAEKRADREQIALHPDDAAARGLATGDIVRVSNARGALLASVRVSDAIRIGVAQMPTGAWWDPVFEGADVGLCRHGNVNALTIDKGTSALAQGPSAISCLVRIERFAGELPAVEVFQPPEIISDNGQDKTDLGER